MWVKWKEYQNWSPSYPKKRPKEVPTKKKKSQFLKSQISLLTITKINDIPQFWRKREKKRKRENE